MTPVGTTPLPLPISPLLVRLSNPTLWLEGSKLAGKVTAWWSVYLVDRNEVTHLCEARPSYYLLYLYDDVELAEGATDEERETAHEWEQGGGENTYAHVSTVERLEACHKVELDEVGVDPDEGRDETLEGLREYYAANCCL